MAPDCVPPLGMRQALARRASELSLAEAGEHDASETDSLLAEADAQRAEADVQVDAASDALTAEAGDAGTTNDAGTSSFLDRPNAAVLSGADDWYGYPNRKGIKKSTDCRAWDCSLLGYQTWY